MDEKYDFLRIMIIKYDLSWPLTITDKYDSVWLLEWLKIMDKYDSVWLLEWLKLCISMTQYDF